MSIDVCGCGESACRVCTPDRSASFCTTCRGDNVSSEPVGSTDYAAMLDGVKERAVQEAQPMGYGIGMARGASAENARIVALLEAMLPATKGPQAYHYGSGYFDAIFEALAAARRASPSSAAVEEQ